MSDAILQVDNLMMRFGGIKALNDVSLRVERGSVTAPTARAKPRYLTA